MDCTTCDKPIGPAPHLVLTDEDDGAEFAYCSVGCATHGEGRDFELCAQCDRPVCAGTARLHGHYIDNGVHDDDTHFCSTACHGMHNARTGRWM